MVTKAKGNILTREDWKEIHMGTFKIAKDSEKSMYLMKSIKQIAITAILVAGIYFSIKELSGKQTFADIAVKIIGDVKVVISYGVAFSGVIYGIRERNVRKKEVKRLANENRELKIIIDPNKGTSNLTTEGENKEEDMI